ncbi:hypothetical protein HDU82_002937 [Entophlyctis luteolus]|nr:hypothetical protein HDU82_002937 [Entophlyctis luteolus]KAJ3391115.1 hypothetical protein HDU84_006482 [Entophlyctis sp. JEL0112]
MISTIIIPAEVEGSAAKRTVVVAVDSSKYAEHAVKWATTEFLQAGDFVVVVNAQRSSEDVMADFAAHSSGAAASDADPADAAAKIGRLGEHAARDILATYVAAVRAGHSGLAGVRGVLLIGTPKEAVVDYVAEIGADALVIGSRGVNALSRALIGSVSDYCLHHCHCPVLVAKPSVAQLKEMFPEAPAAPPASDAMFLALSAA